MTPDSRRHNPDPEYLRGLVARAGLSLRAAAQLLGLSANGFFNYVRNADDPLYRPAPYTVQFALECLASDVEAEQRV